MEKLLLFDGHSILNRAFYALPLLSNSKGVYTNAVYGFINIMNRFIEMEQPTHVAVAFDVHAKTFRHEMYPEYKGTRKSMAQELKEQVPMIKQLLFSMGVKTIEKEGLEADDILGSVAHLARKQGMEVTIVSGDRDLLQLATDHIKISIPSTKKTGTEIEDYYAKDVLEKKGVTPIEFIDVKALWGDTSDNIPGVPGIGEKTATNIIATYHSIEEAYAHVDEIKPPRASANLKEYYEQAKMSKDLATIRINEPLSVSFDETILTSIYTQDAFELCKEWELKSLLPRFDTAKTSAQNATKELDIGLINTFDKALTFVGECMSSDAGEVLGIRLYHEKEQFFAISLSNGKKSRIILLCEEELIKLLQNILQQEANKKRLCFLDVKETLRLLYTKQDKIPKVNVCEQAKMYHDLGIMSYLLHPLQSSYELKDIAFTALGLSIFSYKDLFGKDRLSVAIEQEEKKFCDYACLESYVCAKAPEVLLTQLDEKKMLSLYNEMELPLAFCLLSMELSGIAVDKAALKAYGDSLKTEIDQLEASIHQQAGCTFNILSPKQLGEVLFETLGLKGGKKTKTGYSTAADVLEKLADDHPIIRDILTYRQLTKLKSTYADGLAECIAGDGRIHTTFQQTVTATGRLSSTEPNLQNIPIRMEQGKLIRKVFYPKEGCVFIDADYSQIELRVLAHMSEDEHLIAAYRENQDIHRATASLVFHTPFADVTEAQRRNAKAVNFGIVYGISSFGLGQDLNITRQEAQRYIDDYFIAYPKLKAFLDRQVQSAKESASTQTMMGRIRPIPEITEQNFMRRSFGERIAMNSPIQGSAADIIKLAMIRVHNRLLKENLTSRLILQVHDELLIEANLAEADRVETILVEEMQNAYHLAVPLVADVHRGSSWYDAK